ncbi:MAG TPA: thioredoxin TrxC [Gammaproteobacteria bacterium]|nr:thioredoxin TrxC [Gammaproteobacteria bacterium]
MADSLHIVCPHCDGINRVPQAKLNADPNCGACHRPLFTGEPLALDAARFQRHLGKGELPLLVDFWAAWCGPCKMMAPVFAQAARQLEPQVRLIKINSEEEQPLSSQLGIRSIPTLILYKNSQEAARMSGAMDLGNLLAWARQYL